MPITEPITPEWLRARADAPCNAANLEHYLNDEVHGECSYHVYAALHNYWEQWAEEQKAMLAAADDIDVLRRALELAYGSVAHLTHVAVHGVSDAERIAGLPDPNVVFEGWETQAREQIAEEREGDQ